MALASVCVFFLLFVSQVFGSASDVSRQGNVYGGRREDSACSKIGNRCRCRRTIQKQQSLVCMRENCMKKLPTDEIPDIQLKEVVSLLVTRQRNLTVIGSDELRRLGNIRHIRIFRCRIREIKSNAFVGLNYVERLDLHRNDLSTVPVAIKYLTNLTSLNLGGNNITFVKNDAFYANRHLKKLILSRNFITRMPTLLPLSLTKLSINKNGLLSLEGIRKLAKLKTLNAAGNRLHELPDLPRSLRDLNLCSNKINQTISLAGLPNLKAVNLNHNPRLGHISLSTFYDVNSRSSAFKLVTFQAKNSGVLNVDLDAFSCLSRLQNIELSENLISEYQETWFVGNKRLRSVALSGNNFNCDCDVTSSLQDIAEKFSERRGRKEVTSEDLNGVFTNDFDKINCTHGVVRPCQKFKFRSDYCFKRVHPTRTTSPTAEMTKLPTSSEQSTMLVRTGAITSTIVETSSETNALSTASIELSTSMEMAVETQPTTSFRQTKTKPSSTSTTTTTIATSTTEPEITTSARSRSTSNTFEETTREWSTALIVVGTDAPPTDPTAVTVIPPIETIPSDLVEEEWCWADGRKCHFPFTYQGEEHTECVGTAFGRKWCSDTANYDEDESWDYCKIC